MSRRWWWTARLSAATALLAILVSVGAHASGGGGAAGPTSSDYELLRTLPHDPLAFTQGLAFTPDAATLIESTGLYKGRSSIRQLDPKTGSVLAKRDLSSQFFGEGVAVLPPVGKGQPSRLLLLTWREHTAFVFAADDLSLLHSFEFQTTNGQGWGAVYDPSRHQLVVSDGSPWLMFWDADTYAEVRRVQVGMPAGPTPHSPGAGQGRSLVKHVNELELFEGDLLANLWYTDKIVRVDLDSGDIKAVYDFSDLHPMAERPEDEDCFNGIAVHPRTGTLYVTGKQWHHMYEVRLRR